MRSFVRIFGVLAIAAALPVTAVSAQDSAEKETIVITVPDTVSEAEAKEIENTVKRFFFPPISGTFSTPLGGATISIGRAGTTKDGTARSANISRFENKSADEVSRDFLCDLACNAAAAAAAVACAGSGPVVAACLAAVTVARDECLRRC